MPLVEQFIITAGDFITSPVGPFASEDEAHSYYQSNQPQGMTYLAAPTIVRLLHPAPVGQAHYWAAITEGVQRCP